MNIIKTKFKDLKILDKPTFKDNRGFFRELFLKKYIKKELIFDIMSLSKKNVVRGLHLQTKNSQAKLVTVLRGKIYDVCLDCRKNSKTFGKYFGVSLSENKNQSLFIPEGFAHGFCTLSDKTIVHYKCSNYRDKNSEVGILWNDKDINIKWPIKKPVISKKDKKNYSFKEFTKKFIY
ncbi:dTDP-4-dehydrorhamnose 3,5-epimerase [Candidatus Pelagibacter sp.]|nr:dTDP-4-dehydrorhamnose 3,5-epimerase [Candidatus Pelagibacter sp.]